MQSSPSIVILATLLCFVLVRGQEECDPISYSEGSRRFAYYFYIQARLYARNIIIAPWTVASASAMLGAGAGSVTKQQIWRMLHTPDGYEPFTNESQYLCLLRMYERSSGNDTSEGTNQPLVANRLYADVRFSFLNSYLRKTERYGPRLEKLEFSRNSTAAQKEMNRWVASKTGNKIPQLFWDGRITSEARLVLPSAVYFKGLWKVAFQPEWTQRRKFKISDTEVVKPEFMEGNGKFRTYFNRDFRVRLTELPYQSSGNSSLSMILLTTKTTPKKHHQRKIPRLEQMLSEQRLGPAMAHLFRKDPKNVNIYMPKFKLSQAHDLRWTLLGMNVFSYSLVDFTGMSVRLISTYRDALCVTDFIHKAVLEVDEKGAQTTGEYRRTNTNKRPLKLRIDRPFVTIVYDKQSQRILLIGRVMDPTVRE